MTKRPSRKVMNFRHLLGCDAIALLSSFQFLFISRPASARKDTEARICMFVLQNGVLVIRITASLPKINVDLARDTAPAMINANLD